MALEVDVTLRRLVWEFSEWADKHKQVNDFGYGKYLEVFRSSGRDYAALIVNAPSYTSDKWYINFQFEFICLDYVRDEKEEKDRVNSDTAQILRDLENTVRHSNRWKAFAKVDSTFNAQKIDEYGADKAFGWIATATIKIKRRHGICNIKSLMPEYDFETGAAVVPGCESASLLVNGVSFTDIASGATFDLPVKDDNGATVGSKVGSEWIVPAAGGDPVANTMNGASLTDAVAGTTKNFTIRYEDDSAVTVTTISDSATAFIGEVPNNVSGIAYVRNSFNPNDGESVEGSSGWYKSNTDIHVYNVVGLTPILDPDDNTKLLTNNFWGNLNRITNDKGNQNFADVGGGLTSDGATANYIVDNYTGKGWYGLDLDAGTLSWDDSVTEAQAFTLTAFDSTVYGSTDYGQFTMPQHKDIENILLGTGDSNNIIRPYSNWGTDLIAWVMYVTAGGTSCYFWRENQNATATNIFQSFSRTSANSSISLRVVRNHF